MFTNHVGPLKGEEGLFSPSMEDIAYSGIAFIWQVTAGVVYSLNFFKNVDFSLFVDLTMQLTVFLF